jgi:hypothetical protein
MRARVWARVPTCLVGLEEVSGAQWHKGLAGAIAEFGLSPGVILPCSPDNRSSGAQRDRAGCASSQRYPYGSSSKDLASSSS